MSVPRNQRDCQNLLDLTEVRDIEVGNYTEKNMHIIIDENKQPILNKKVDEKVYKKKRWKNDYSSTQATQDENTILHILNCKNFSNNMAGTYVWNVLLCKI